MAEVWQRGRVTLKWSPEHELHGLEVVMRRQPFGQVINDWMAEGEGKAPWDDLTPKQRAERSTEAAEDLVAQIISWNFGDDDGNPVPVSVDGLLGECDSVMINQMQLAYSEATTRMPPPLSLSSDDGPPGEWDLPAQETLTATPPD